ncbi:MAG: hypothetical protein MRERV_48c009 [Mycoplasmataceae bacterium RV_VA103A]|nr:MAG: hypothetical protein MRERV_48c009 [Mycoplasmataceae bacterium RV_VA103A]
MYIQNLLEDIKKLKFENKQLEFDKTLLQTQLETFKKVDYADLSNKLSRMRKIALARLVKEAILDKRNVNLTYELAKAENSLTSLNEDNQHLINTKSDLENKVNDLEEALNSNKINKEELAKKLLELNDFLKRPISLAEKLTIPASDWTYLHTTLENIAKISEENLFSIKQKEAQISKLQTEKEQLEKDKGSLQVDLAAHVKLLEEELAKAKLTPEEKEIIELIQKLRGEKDKSGKFLFNLFNKEKNLTEKTTLAELKTKKLEGLPHLNKMPSVFVLIYDKLMKKYEEIDNKQETINKLQNEINEARKKITKLESKIRELENKDRDTLILLQTANNQKDAIAAERDLLQTKIAELKNKVGQLELDLKLIQSELAKLRTQKSEAETNTETAKKKFEARIRELKNTQLTENEKNIIRNLQELFDLTATSGLTKTNLERVKSILIKLRTYNLTNNSNLNDLPVAIYNSMNALVISQELIWDKETEATETIRALEKDINLQAGEKNKLLEWLEVYRDSNLFQANIYERNFKGKLWKWWREFFQQHRKKMLLFSLNFNCDEYYTDLWELKEGEMHFDLTKLFPELSFQSFAFENSIDNYLTKNKFITYKKHSDTHVEIKGNIDQIGEKFFHKPNYRCRKLRESNNVSFELVRNKSSIPCPDGNIINPTFEYISHNLDKDNHLITIKVVPKVELAENRLILVKEIIIQQSGWIKGFIINEPLSNFNSAIEAINQIAASSQKTINFYMDTNRNSRLQVIDEKKGIIKVINYYTIST